MKKKEKPFIFAEKEFINKEFLELLKFVMIILILGFLQLFLIIKFINYAKIKTNLGIPKFRWWVESETTR